jgi:addiction module RelE/StbE family toxin
VRVRWTTEALEDRLQIWDYIAAEDPQAVVRLDQRIADTVSLLREHPEMGRPGMIAGTRELIPHENYRVVYEIARDVVWILAVVHAARNWPSV